MQKTSGANEMKYLRPITETSYLTAGNASRYRRIMRTFFEEYEKMHYQLYKEDIFEKLRTDPDFSDYSMEQLVSDLDALTAWKNLLTIQDPKRVYSIAEYKSKQFRYSMSDFAVEIERMTVRLENLKTEGGNLSTNYFARIEEAMEGMERIAEKPLREINAWWRGLESDFRLLNQNYQDYLREFYSGKADKIMKSMEFIVHKDRFVQYLRDFVQELQTDSVRIENLIGRIPEETQRMVLEKVIESELEIPRTFSTSSGELRTEISGSVYGKWESVKGWFISAPPRQSECARILDITNEIIRKIIQNAALIVQLQNWGFSRKEDYRRFISLFLKCESLEEAHCLAAHLFGVQHVRHFKYNEERSTDSISSSTYEEDALEFPVQPHTRSYKPRMNKTGFRDKTMEKLEQKTKYRKNAEKQNLIISRYIRNGRLDFSELKECISAETRKTLLQWVVSAEHPRKKGGIRNTVRSSGLNEGRVK